MQRYDEFQYIPTFIEKNISGCSDRETILRQNKCKGLKSVVKPLKIREKS